MFGAKSSTDFHMKYSKQLKVYETMMVNTYTDMKKQKDPAAKLKLFETYHKAEKEFVDFCNAHKFDGGQAYLSQSWSGPFAKRDEEYKKLKAKVEKKK